MDLQTFTEPKKICLNLEGITKITYEIQHLVINTKCDIMVCFHDINKSDSFYFKFTLQGDDYNNWKDDQYIIDYINNMINKMIA